MKAPPQQPCCAGNATRKEFIKQLAQSNAERRISPKLTKEKAARGRLFASAKTDYFLAASAALPAASLAASAALPAASLAASAALPAASLAASAAMPAVLPAEEAAPATAAAAALAALSTAAVAAEAASAMAGAAAADAAAAGAAISSFLPQAAREIETARVANKSAFFMVIP